MIPKLETGRLVLRAFELTDAPTVQRLAGASQIADTTVNIPHPYPNGLAEEWIASHVENFQTGKELVLAITLKSSYEIIGTIGLVLDDINNKAELGYWIGTDYWNMGYATEAAKEIIRFGFDEMNLNKIFAHYMARNPASGKVMEKIGMQKEGFLREHIIKFNCYEDLYFYSILKKDYDRQK